MHQDPFSWLPPQPLADVVPVQVEEFSNALGSLVARTNLPGSQSVCNRFSQHWREPPINPAGGDQESLLDLAIKDGDGGFRF